MPYDPSTYYQEQLRRLTNPGAAPSAPPSEFPPLTPEEEQSALGGLGRKVLSGVGYVGSVLDKAFGGRALRGVLGGKPHELLSLIPFSDTLGITDENDVVHGRDLLEQAGVVPHGTPGSGIDLGDVLGFGLDVALDPSVYFGNFLAKPLGAAAGQAGKAALKLPGAARAYEALRPAGRGLTALFDPAVMDTIGEKSQAAMRGVSEALPGAKYAQRKAAADVFEGLRGPTGDVDPATVAAFANVLEGSPPAPPWAPPPAAPAVPVAGPAAQARGLLDARNAAERQAGMLAPYLENYLPVSKMAVEAGATSGGGYTRASAALDPFHRHMIGRDVELLGDLPRHGWVNPLTANPEAAVPGLSQMTPLQAQAALRQNVLYPWEEAKLGLGRQSPLQPGTAAGQMEQRWINLNNLPARTPAEEAELAHLSGLHKQSERLADWLATPEMRGYAEHGLPLFGGSPLENILGRLERGVAGEEKTKALLGLLQNAAGPATADSVPLTKVLGGMQHLDQPTARNLLMQSLGVSAPDLERLHVPAEIAADVGRAIKGFTLPTALEPVANAVDSFTSLFRGLNAALVPGRLARFSRNLGQQVWGMFVGGHADPTAGALDGYLKPMREASQLLRAGPDYVLPDANTIPGLTHLSPEEATRELQKEMFATGAAGPGRTTGKVEASGPGALHAAAQEFRLPGSEQPGLGEIARSAVPGSLEEAKPWNIRGVGGREVSTFAPSRAGHELDALIDDATRGGSYLALRRQGLNPLQAAAEVRKIHYDYGALSSFEKAIMRRAFPFYSWVRQNVPAQLSQLWESPGGKTAQAIRATGDLRQKEGFVPPDIAETIGLPLGAETPEGTQRYLTTLGLPFEDLSDLVTGRGSFGDVSRTLGNVASQMNPLLKAPVEIATGTQLTSGRQLQDLYPITGNVLVDQAIMNAPGSSLYTSGRTLLDPRKDLVAKLTNLVGPARVTDVDMEKRRSIAARDLVNDLLRGEPGVHFFERPYTKTPEQLSPEGVELMRLQATLEREAQQRAKEKKVGVKR